MLPEAEEDMLEELIHWLAGSRDPRGPFREIGGDQGPLVDPDG